jgi:GDP-D-mannose 3', 5'-epimerase
MIKTAYIGGGNGFVGHYLARRLKSEGYWVRVVDIETYKYGANDYADEIVIADLRDRDLANSTMRLDDTFEYKHYPTPFAKEVHFDEVYNLCCLMGGMGFIGDPAYTYDVMVGSTEMTLNVLQSAIKHKAKKIFYSSSACVYNENLQKESYGLVSGLKESDAYPSLPDLVYGWQKLFSEQLHQASKELIDIRIARFHNIYGPEGTYQGGKEKAPAAIARKIAYTNDHCNVGIGRGIGNIDVWGDGEQTRSFLYIDDCIDAVRLLMQSDYDEPINIGSEEMVSINELVKITAIVAKKVIIPRHDLTKPQGVRGRNSNNELIERVLGWKPKYTLRQGMEKTYKWIKSQVDAAG